MVWPRFAAVESARCLRELRGGHFKDIHGTLESDLENPQATSAEVTIDDRRLWNGEPDRDAHLKSADFLDVEKHPTITSRGDKVELMGANEAKLKGT